MDFTVFLDVAFVVIYGAILGLVAPFVGLASERYHVVLPGIVATIYGAILWAILTWVGMDYTQPWIWLIVMLTMPVAMWFGAKRIEASRSN
ncbi:MAG: hypothetical protein KGL77_01060 [Actinomycetales bacterium]|nr:hypothetical protein [Actinomycetales bacterium]